MTVVARCCRLGRRAIIAHVGTDMQRSELCVCRARDREPCEAVLWSALEHELGALARASKPVHSHTRTATVPVSPLSASSEIRAHSVGCLRQRHVTRYLVVVVVVDDVCRCLHPAPSAHTYITVLLDGTLTATTTTTRQSKLGATSLESVAGGRTDGRRA